MLWCDQKDWFCKEKKENGKNVKWGKNMRFWFDRYDESHSMIIWNNVLIIRCIKKYFEWKLGVWKRI